MEMKEINELYVNNEYEKLHDYLEAHKSEDLSTYLYNKGLVFYKQGELAKARLYWERAVNKGSTSTEVVHNLKVVKSDLGVSAYEGDGLKPLTISFAQSDIFFSIVLIFLLTALWSLLKKLYRYSSFFGLLSLSLLLLRFIYIDSFHYSISQKETPIREGPSKIFESKSNLPEGIKIILKKQVDGWALITYPENFVGWVKISSFERI